MTTYALIATPNVSSKQEAYMLCEKYMQRIELFESMGLNPLIMCDDEKPTYNLGTLLREVLPGNAFTVPKSLCKKEIDFIHALGWPRDILQVFDNTAFIAPRYKKLGLRILDRLNFSGDSFIGFLGEGGCSVPAGNILLYAGIEKLFDESDFIETFGFTALPMPLYADPESYCEKERELSLRFDRTAHIDTEIGLVQTPDDNHLLLVTPEMQMTFFHYFERLRKSLDAKLWICPEPHQLQPTNFVSIPNKRVIISQKCKPTTQFLKRNLGEKRVISLPLIDNETNEFGGLRCRINILEIK